MAAASRKAARVVTSGWSAKPPTPGKPLVSGPDVMGAAVCNGKHGEDSAKVASERLLSTSESSSARERSSEPRPARIAEMTTAKGCYEVTGGPSRCGILRSIGLGFASREAGRYSAQTRMADRLCKSPPASFWPTQPAAPRVFDRASSTKLRVFLLRRSWANPRLIW